MDIAHSSETRRDFASVLFFALTLFMSASLMFILQPMFGKLLLPALGGAASVWNTCMVFYQTLLFVGYLYAHYLTRHFNPKQQIRVHSGLLLLSLLFIPIGIVQTEAPPTDSTPVFWLLSVLFGSIGLPFFILSTTSPLIQKWFSCLGHAHSSDPYFLSIASNSGSLLALLSYPLIFESQLGLSDQQRFWSMGFVLLLALVLLCMAFYKQSRQDTALTFKPAAHLLSKPTLAQQLHWLILALVPSSLLIGTTHYLSTDIASVPLLWIIPLALYLLSFILVFSRYNDNIHPWISRLQPWIVVPFLIYFLSDEKLADYSLELALHLLIFFICIMFCHGELARRRPQPEYLTQYYLIMSLGGMLGGVFNNFVVPFVFDDLYEYPLMIIAALMLNTVTKKHHAPIPNKIFLVSLLLYLMFFGTIVYQYHQDIANNALIALIVIAILSNYFMFHKNMLYLFLYSSLLVSCTTSFTQQNEQTLMKTRNFYGVLSVTQTTLPNNDSGLENDILHAMYSGTTQHGAQLVNNNNQCTPVSYYSVQGPIGQVFQAYQDSSTNWNIGIVGLGSGALGSYATSNQHWHFYELNPAVIRMATTPAYFSYLQDCMSQYAIYPGDARLTLDKQANQYFDLLVIDAFTSDAIPTHLLTREALELYLARLTENGILAFHISNHYLDLEPVLADHAHQLGLYGLIQKHRPQSKSQIFASDWVLLSKNMTIFSPLLTQTQHQWRQLATNTAFKQSWTDDFTSLISVWKH